MKKLVSILCTLILFYGCTTKKKELMPALAHRKIILFIPGYYGSILSEKKSKKIRWASASDFFLSQKGIATTVDGTNIIEDSELVPTAVLTHVTIFPFLIKIDSYGKTLKQLQHFADTNAMNLETVAYDWRDDFIVSLKLIDEKIKGLKLEASDELYVVSHSTGALLMAYYLRYGAQDVDNAKETWEGAKLIKKAVLAAAPFHGLMVLLRDTEAGTTKGLNKELMSARDYSSFKSSYMFLPPEGEDNAVNILDGRSIPLNLHDPETWEKNKWGIFKFISSTEAATGKLFIGKYMSRSQKFHNLLRAPIKNNPPAHFPLFYTWGTGHKTVQIGYVKPLLDGSKEIDFSQKRSFVDGDGTVTADSGKPLQYFTSLNATLRQTKHSHLDSIVNKDNQKAIQDFLLER
jgi:hypothetical protein